MHKAHVSITYCTQCNWLLRSGWMAQELLSTFAEDLGGVTLIPGTGGIFEIRVDETLIWERKRDGEGLEGFPPLCLRESGRHRSPRFLDLRVRRWIVFESYWREPRKRGPTTNEITSLLSMRFEPRAQLARLTDVE